MVTGAPPGHLVVYPGIETWRLRRRCELLIEPRLLFVLFSLLRWMPSKARDDAKDAAVMEPCGLSEWVTSYSTAAQRKEGEAVVGSGVISCHGCQGRMCVQIN